MVRARQRGGGGRRAWGGEKIRSGEDKKGTGKGRNREGESGQLSVEHRLTPYNTMH